ncbi:Hypothetical protein D9617_2g058220 [Elsinoe fawcettii]|nr:Hypothetical protein D9617_2g058220 [Elsinoe fawcettii]
MSAPINNAATPARPDQTSIAPLSTAPPQTMASLERATTPTAAPPQTIANLYPVTPIAEKPALMEDHTAAPLAPKTETVITHETIIVPVPVERHTGATPAPQIAPISVAVPPVPSTTTIITVPPSPEHITIAPAVAPVLAVVPGSQLPPSAHSQSAKAEPSKVGEAANHPVERVDTLADLQAHTAPRSRRNSASDYSTVTKSKPTGLGLHTGRATSSGDLRSGQPSPMIPTGAVERVATDAPQ